MVRTMEHSLLDSLTDSARQWGADLRRQNALHGAGLVLLRYPVRRLREEGEACGAEMRRLVA